MNHEDHEVSLVMRDSKPESTPGGERTPNGLCHLGVNLSRDPVGDRVDPSIFYGRNSLSRGWRCDVSVRAISWRKNAIIG